MNGWIRQTLDVGGVVQGVGFRPTVHRLAVRAGLGGWVQNRTKCVRIALEGPAEDVLRFIRDLPRGIPPLARLDFMTPGPVESITPPPSRPVFSIRDSEFDAGTRPAVPPDLAICADCRREIFDPTDRRFGYPFTTCCNCGPRYTVIETMPYDRERTTLRAFPLCPECRREYGDPRGRRFHAESIACPACGPRLGLADADGRLIEAPHPIRRARSALADGGIVALRGIGGFLLAADARNDDAIRRLRERKRRPHKPFAVMAADLDAARRVCEIDEPTARLLESPEAPIVILPSRPDASVPLRRLAPDTATLGLLLPTSPLHELLARPLPGDTTPLFDLLVMTSGNHGGAPICMTNEEALEDLRGIADLFLLHDRPINLRADDSIAVPRGGGHQVWRRARGFAPEPIRLHRPLRRAVLAMGAELKNTVAVGIEAEVYLSPHLGDLETPEAVAHCEKVADRLPEFLGVRPECVAVDLHPDMHSTRLGTVLARRWGIPLVPIQHHHAHAAACMAEHGADDALAIIFDGIGLGADGSLRGGELFHLPSPRHCLRLGTFEPAPLPGGDAAVREPRRQIVARWAALGLHPNAGRLARIGADEHAAAVWIQLAEDGVLAPTTHAAGRVFDAVAAALNLAPDTVTYEGQTAIRLEAAAASCLSPNLASPPRIDPFAPDKMWGAAEMDGELRIDWSPLFRLLYEVPPDDDDAPRVAAAFHEAMADAAARMARHGRDATGCRTVVLSGGVMMNRILHAWIRSRLIDGGFRVLTPSAVPPNDGGVSLGQCVIAGG